MEKHYSHELIADYLGGFVAKEKRIDIANHLESCERCATIARGIAEAGATEVDLLETKLRQRVAAGEFRRASRKVKGSWMLRAAAVLFVVGLSVLVWQQVRSSAPSTDNIVAQHLEEHYSSPIVLRGEPNVDSLRSIATTAYQENDFTRASTEFAQLVEVHGEKATAEDHFYLGISLLYSDKLEQSIASLAVVEQSNSRYQQQGRWYLSLALWKNGDSIGAQEYWEYISVNEDHYKQAEARELLESSE